MDRLIQSGEYNSKSDIVNRAVVELIQREDMKPDFQILVKQYLESDEGIALIRKVAGLNEG